MSSNSEELHDEIHEFACVAQSLLRLDRRRIYRQLCGLSGRRRAYHKLPISPSHSTAGSYGSTANKSLTNDMVKPFPPAKLAGEMIFLDVRTEWICIPGPSSQMEIQMLQSNRETWLTQLSTLRIKKVLCLVQPSRSYDGTFSEGLILRDTNHCRA